MSCFRDINNILKTDKRAASDLLDDFFLYRESRECTRQIRRALINYPGCFSVALLRGTLKRLVAKFLQEENKKAVIYLKIIMDAWCHSSSATILSELKGIPAEVFEYTEGEFSGLLDLLLAENEGKTKVRSVSPGLKTERVALAVFERVLLLTLEKSQEHQEASSGLLLQQTIAMLEDQSYKAGFLSQFV